MTETERTIYIGSLTEPELLCLDGLCRPDVQEKVNIAKRRAESVRDNPDMIPHDAAFVGDVLRYAEKEKKLSFMHQGIRSCPVCGQDAGYALRTRNSRAGKKGTPNRKKPLTIRGVELGRSFLNVVGHVWCGCCGDCWKRIQPLLEKALADVRAEMPEAITGHPPRYRRAQIMLCSKCGWRGSETAMGRLPAMMQGTYPGKCPKCGAKNLPFCPHVLSWDKEYVVEEVSDNQ